MDKKKVAITKDVLRKLQSKRGCLEKESGLIFVQFVGRLFPSSGLYEGDCLFSKPGPEHQGVSEFNLSEVLDSEIENKAKSDGIHSDNRLHIDSGGRDSN